MNLPHLPRFIRSLSLALLSACLLFGVSSALQAQDPEQAIRHVMSAQADAWNRGDLEAFMAGYWKSPQVIFTSRGQVRRGWQATLQSYRAHYGSDTSSMGHLEFSHLEIHQLDSDSAWVLGRWTLTGGDEDSTGIFTLIFRRLDAKWVIVMDHSSAAAG